MFLIMRQPAFLLCFAMRILTMALLVLILSCKNKQKNTNTVANFTVYPATGDTSSWIGKYYISISTRMLNLPDLSKGTPDSMEIRVWRHEFLDLFENVFIFKLDSNGWKGFHYNSWTMPWKNSGQVFRFQGQPKMGDSVLIVKEIVPKCDWQKFSDSISFFQIPTLPTQDSIKDFKFISHTDGNNYSFEIATPVSYRYLFYDMPDYYQHKECKSVKEFLAMLTRQFGGDFNWPWQWRVLNKKPPE
jgi:hypothetical protein